MKNRTLRVIAVAVGCGLAAASGVYAADQGTSTAAPKAASSETVQGSITSLSLEGASPSVTVRGSTGQSWNLAFDSKATTIWVGGQKGMSSQLKVGQQVKVKYADQMGKRVAKSIEVTSGAGN